MPPIRGRSADSRIRHGLVGARFPRPYPFFSGFRPVSEALMRFERAVIHVRAAPGLDTSWASRMRAIGGTQVRSERFGALETG